MTGSMYWWHIISGKGGCSAHKWIAAWRLECVVKYSRSTSAYRAPAVVLFASTHAMGMQSNIAPKSMPARAAVADLSFVEEASATLLFIARHVLELTVRMNVLIK